METDAKDVKRKGAWRDAKGSPSVTYTPRPDASPEGELTALANVYRYLLFHRHETSEDVEADGDEKEAEHAE